MKVMTDRLRTCCPGSDCASHSASLDFLRRQGIEPVLGEDEDGHYMDFHVSARKRREFQRALRRWLSSRVEAARQLARRMWGYVNERAKVEGIGICFDLAYFENAVLSGHNPIFGVRHNCAKMLGDEQEPYDGYFARHAPNG